MHKPDDEKTQEDTEMAEQNTNETSGDGPSSSDCSNNNSKEDISDGAKNDEIDE